MRKYKVNRGTPVKMPSKEAIEKYKDFSRLRHEYDSVVKRPKKPLYQDRKLYWIVLLVILLTLLIMQAISEEEENDKNDDTGWVAPPTQSPSEEGTTFPFDV